MSEAAKHTPRVTADASELAASDRYCTCCGRELKRRFAWLELDQRTDQYHDFGGVPDDKSQGWFPFGMSCARAAIRRAEGKALQADER